MNGIEQVGILAVDEMNGRMEDQKHDKKLKAGYNRRKTETVEKTERELYPVMGTLSVSVISTRFEKFATSKVSK